MVRHLFTIEVPEIAGGTVEIKAIAREAGSRTKIAVFSDEVGVDPIGSCVGQKGTRVQSIIDELGGEKIDIIEWNENPEKFITAALAPAKVLGVTLFEEEARAETLVPADQLSLAIGKRGQNVRLAAKLTGWKLDVIGDTPAESSELVEGEEVEETEEIAESTPAEVSATDLESTPKESRETLETEVNEEQAEVTAAEVPAEKETQE
jgi:N utilization substance protein A